MASKGKRIVFEPEARAWDEIGNDKIKEFHRKVRTLTGNYQLIELAPWLLTRANPLRFRFFSHKLARLVAPFALTILFVTSFWLQGLIYRDALILQACFYASSAGALFRPFGIATRLGKATSAFLLLNAAAVVALFTFISGRRRAAWARL